LVDSANNTENIVFLKRMIQQNKLSDAILIFGTTQTDAEYVKSLIALFPHHEKILVDGFCERALPCSQYQSNDSSLWHLDKPE